MQSFEELRRTRVPQLEEILGKSFPVLDDGFVRVIDYMGSDKAVVSVPAHGSQRPVRDPQIRRDDRE